MTQQTTLQKIRFENGLAVAKSKIEYVMCRIEEIRLQLQGVCFIEPLEWIIQEVVDQNKEEWVDAWVCES